MYGLGGTTPLAHGKDHRGRSQHDIAPGENALQGRALGRRVDDDPAPARGADRGGRLGDEGVGLKVVNKDDTSVALEGGGGYVRINACAGTKTEVRLLTREWDNQVKSFMEAIKS